MKPSSKPPFSSEPPSLSEIPSSGIPSKPLTVDQMLTEMTPEQRKLLKIFLQSSNPFALRYIYGSQADWISYRLEELISTYKSNSEAVKSVLLVLLEDFPDSDESVEPEVSSVPDTPLAEDSQAQTTIRSAIQEVISPFADTVLSSVPPAPAFEFPAPASESLVMTEAESPWETEGNPDENRTPISKPQTSSNNIEDNAAAAAVQKVGPKGSPKFTDSPWVDQERSKDDINIYIARLSPEKKNALPDYLTVNRNDRGEVAELATKHGKNGLELDYELTQMAEKLGCSIDELRAAATIVLRGGHVVTDNLRKKKIIINTAIDSRQQQTVMSSRKMRGELKETPKKGVFARLFRRRDT